jgi:foldase protein PrsA
LIYLVLQSYNSKVTKIEEAGELMKRFKFLTVMMALLGLALMVSGCGQKYVAKVNGESITVDEYKTMAKLYGANLSDANERNKVLETLINDKVIVQFAAKKGIKLTDEEINKEIDELVKTNFGGDKKKLNDQLANAGFTLESYKKFRKVEQTKAKLQEKYITPSEKDVKEYFDKNKASLGQMVKASHILVSTEKEAKDIIAKLKAGADFGKLAVEKSTEPAAKQTKGDLGWFIKGSMVPEFEQAAFSMKVGELSKPVKTQFGFHVIKLVDKKSIEFDLIKDKINQIVTGKKYQEFNQEISKAIKEAQVEKKTENIPTKLDDKKEAPKGNEKSSKK